VEIQADDSNTLERPAGSRKGAGHVSLMERSGGGVYIHGITRYQVERQSEASPVGHVRAANRRSKQCKVIRGGAAPAFAACHFPAGKSPLSRPWRALKEGRSGRA